MLRAINIGKKIVAGDDEKSYAKVPQYIAILKETNEGVVVKLKCIELDLLNPRCNSIFEIFYIGFEAQGYDFVNGCRRIIVIDACFLKGPFQGQLLIAILLEVNSDIFSLAIMIANKEDGSTWKYFLDCLSNSVGDR